MATTTNAALFQPEAATTIHDGDYYEADFVRWKAAYDGPPGSTWCGYVVGEITIEYGTDDVARRLIVKGWKAAS